MKVKIIIPSALGLLLIISFLFPAKSLGQTPSNNCPPNIGFENGGFDGWECSSGSVLGDGSLSLMLSGALPDIHTLFPYTNPQVYDPYGNFPVNCPNGSNYSIRLGNDGVGSQAERVSYTFTIPADQQNYSIIYNYAVVIQNPDHQPYQQPQFTSQVFDVTSNEYISCASFEFVASGNLPGFQLSSVGDNVYYKPWSPITINLSGYAGKTIRLEFTNNDCTLGGHFGYAYLDINENCASPIAGNVYCSGASSLTLTAPFGFNSYSWFNADLSQQLGNNSTLTLTPPPPHNSVFALVLEPYIGLGCQDTLYTTIDASPQVLNLVVLDTLTGCSSPGVDITAGFVTAGSTPGLTYGYYLDPGGTEYIPAPTTIPNSGTYYIQGINSVGCREIKPVVIVAQPPPNILVSAPDTACFPGTVDLTHWGVTTGSDPGLNYTYHTDQHGIFNLSGPQSVATGGIYFIKGTNNIGCYAIKPVNVVIADMGVSNVNTCGLADLTSPENIPLSVGGFTYTYWLDALATQGVVDPASVTSSGMYYVRGEHASGCSIIKPFQVMVRPLPDLYVTNPPQVSYPERIDLTRTFIPAINTAYTFWKDASATIPLENPESINLSGTYFIKAVNQANCTVIKPVEVDITPPPPAMIKVPNSFSPNGDGTHDVLIAVTVGELQAGRFQVFNRWGQLVFQGTGNNIRWDGQTGGKDLPVATYYWTFEGADGYYKKKVNASGSITLIR